MNKPVLKVGLTDESKLVRKLLKDKNIEVVIDYSRDPFKIPTLYTEDSIYPFKGIS